VVFLFRSTVLALASVILIKLRAFLASICGNLDGIQTGHIINRNVDLSLHNCAGRLKWELLILEM
jgi:hypothetical protein